MSAHVASGERPQTVGEEIANSVSHGLATLATLIATPFVIVDAAARGDAANVVGAVVFTACALLLYLTSTLYHALARNRAKPVFQLLDHGAIFLLIAGTYTPFALGVLRGPWGWTLFVLVWGLAAIGIFAKARFGTRFPRLSIALYLGMGWLALIAIVPLWQLVPAWGLFWLLAGGVCYTAGVAFFASDDRVRYHHFVWHLFVVAGTACHFVAVLYFAQ